MRFKSVGTPFTFTDSSVPELRPFELIGAWEAAFTAGFEGINAPDSFAFTFHDAGQIKQLQISDSDACAWLTGIDTVLALNTEKGASAALRFLALIEVLGTCDWAGHLLQEGENGLNVHPALIRVAAYHPLSIGHPFDDKALHKMLVQDSENGLGAAANMQGI